MLMIGSLLIQAVTFLLRPASAYQALNLDVPAAAIGAIAATFAVVPLVLALPLGGFVDRLGATLLLRIGSVIVLGASTVLLLLDRSVAGLIAGNALLGAGHLCCIVSQQTLVADGADHSRLDAVFGYYTFAASLGQAVGPALIATLGGTQVQLDTGPVFLAGMVLSVLLVASSLVTRSSRGIESGDAPVSAMSTRVLLRTPGLKGAIATSALIVSAVDLTLVYLPALGAERQFTAATVGALLSVRALTSMASRLLLGTMSRRFGRSRVMVSSIVISAATLGAAAMPMPVCLLFVVVALLGLGLGVGQPLTMSWVSERAPRGQRGKALSIRLAGNRVGQVGIPAATGVVAAGLGASGVLGAMALIVGSTLWLMRGSRLD